MSEVNVLRLLDVAYSGTKEERTHATEQLESLFQSDSAPHYILMILNSALDPMLPAEKRLSGLIYIKNCLMHTTPETVLAQAPEVLEQIKQTLFSGVFQVPTTHRRVICECVSTLISGFQWNYLRELLPIVEQLSSCGSAPGVAGSPAFSTPEHASTVLEMLYSYIKRFKTPGLDNMSLKLEVCSALMEPLFKFLGYNNFQIAKMVFKVAEAVVETALQQKNAKVIPANSLDAWFASMMAFLEKSHQDASALGGKAYEEYLKCVKRIAMITFSVMNDATRHRKPAPVAAHFLKTHAAAFLNIWQSWLGFCLQSSDCETYRHSEMFAIRYLKLCTLDETLYTGFIRPSAMSIIEHLLFPYLCFGGEDEKAFADETDLTSYVQYMMDEGLDNGELTQRHAASNAILSIIGGKRKFHDTGAVLQLLLQVLTTGLSLDTTEANFPRLYGFLQLLSVLRKYLCGVKEIWEGPMAQVLMHSVAPRLQPEVAFVPLRCKAVVVCQRYAKVPMPTSQDFAAFIAMISGLVEDRDARVRLAAIDAMCTFLEMKRARPYLTPVLVPLVEECISFMNRVQTTFVPTVILHLATHFAPEMAPVMGKLGRALVQHFLAIAFNMEQQQETMELDPETLVAIEQTALSADALLEAIYTVVLSCSENKTAFLDMRPDIQRLVRSILQQSESFDFMEKALHIFLHVVRFSGNEIPSESWEMLPLIFQSVESGIGVDFFVGIEEVLDNFISGATVAYLTNGPIMEATFNACQKMLIGGVVCGSECKIAAAQLIEAMLHQAKGCSEHPGLLNAHLPHFVNLLLKALIHPDTQGTSNIQLRIWIVAALMDCFYYNACITLDTMVQSNAHTAFFHGFFQLFQGCIPQFFAAASAPATKKGKPKRSKAHSDEVEVVEHLSLLTRKVIILGLTSLMAFGVDCEALQGKEEGGGGVATATQHVACAFVAQHLPQAAAMVQYCIFTNEQLYAVRCRVSERNLHAIRRHLNNESDDTEEDADLFGEDELGLDGADDMDVISEMDVEDEEDLSKLGDNDEDFFDAALDEGDDYESPIDDINEVRFFLQWLGPFLQHPQQESIRGSVLSILKTEDAYANAEQTAQKYREFCKELEVAEREGYHERERRAVS